MNLRGNFVIVEIPEYQSITEYSISIEHKQKSLCRNSLKLLFIGTYVKTNFVQKFTYSHIQVPSFARYA